MSKSDADTLQARRLRLQQDQQLIQQQLAARLAVKECVSNSQLEASLRQLLQYRKQGHDSQKRFELFAYNLYCSKPQIYRRLKTLLQLPDESFFQNYKLYLAPKFEECILYFLSSKLSSLKPEVNHFVLCVDQHPLNRNCVYDTKRDILLGLHNVDGVEMNGLASMAYVMMLRSLCINWMQPVAYAFRNVSCATSAPRLTTWCAQVINKLCEIGIQVEAVITRPDFISHVYSRANDGNRTDITFRGTKVYHLHDVRVLIEEVRNCLIEDDFYFNESRISWHYMKMLYYQQRDSDSELMADIKEVHIYPSRRGSRWKHAKEIFSQKVYAALNRLMSSGALPHEARPTANFVRAMSELYEVAYYSPRARAAVDVKRQIEVLERSADMFRNIHLRSGHVPAPALALAPSLAAMAALLQDLAEMGFKTVNTSRLNNAPVQAFFRAVPRTAKPGRRLKPTASQVYTAFADAFTRSMRRRPRWARREELAAAAASGLLDARRAPAPPPAPPPRSALRALRPHHYRVPLPRAPAAEASFLLYHCMRVHSCPELEEALQPRRPLLNIVPGSKASIEFWERLLEPPAQFQRYVQDLKERLPKLLRANMFRSPGASALRALSREAAGALPCACFPRRVLLALLVRRQMWLTIKDINERTRHSDNRNIWITFQPTDPRRPRPRPRRRRAPRRADEVCSCATDRS